MTAQMEDVANATFDFIICGGGTAGLTLAARLSEDPDVTVLVLEAGGANLHDPDLLRPVTHGKHFGNARYDWGYQTLVQQDCRDTHYVWNRGKGLGGSSGINFMVWTKPTAEEINDFEHLGNPGWNWESYERALSRTEGFIPPSSERQKMLHLNHDTTKMGTDGPLKITYPATLEIAELKMRETFVNAGINIAANPMSGNPNGTYFAPHTYDPTSHTRSYAATAFYLPSVGRPNLTVLVHAQATQIITRTATDGKLTATGVRFAFEGVFHAVHARREVIPCAGAIQSPHLLEMSGIGDSKLLSRIGITPKLDLPGVGRNVQEHYHLDISFELRDDVKWDNLSLLLDPTVAAKHLELYGSGKGLHTSGVINVAFISPLVAARERVLALAQRSRERFEERRDTYDLVVREQHEILLKRLEGGAPMCEIISFPGFMAPPDANPPVPGKKDVTLQVCMNMPFSRGTIHTSSSDPLVPPEVDPHYLEEEIDLQITIEMVKFARRMADVSPLKDMIVREVNPGPEIGMDDQSVREYVKRYMDTMWHTIGSCSMLPLSKGGVVDPQLKVYGTTNIRVVDLSIAPLHFSAHALSTAYAIAERAAEIVTGRAKVPWPEASA